MPAAMITCLVKAGRRRPGGDLEQTDRTAGIASYLSTLEYSMINTQRQDINVLAAQTIRNLLAGQPPNGMVPESCGEWAEVVAELFRAYDEDGTAAVKIVFGTLAKANPSLAHLIAGADTGSNKTSWTVAELLAAKFPEPKWAVPHIIPQGVTNCAGRPKIGKSWMGLQIAHAVGTGGQTLGQKVEAAMCSTWRLKTAHDGYRTGYRNSAFLPRRRSGLKPSGSRSPGTASPI